MATVKQVLGDVFAKLLFREVMVRSVHDVSPRFRRLDLEGPALRQAPFGAGDKVQVMMPNGDLRTYTPFHFDATRGSLSFLVYVHGDDSPGAQWGRSVSAGQTARLFGPRGSLRLASDSGPAVVFGDETSFALARALREQRAGTERLRFVFEVNDAAESARALESLELSSDGLVQRLPGDTHLAAVESQLRQALTTLGDASLVLTGRAQSIQALRMRLRASGTAAHQRVKAYWSVGKRGLD